MRDAVAFSIAAAGGTELPVQAPGPRWSGSSLNRSMAYSKSANFFEITSAWD